MVFQVDVRQVQVRAKKRAFSVETKGSAKRGSAICRNASWRHQRHWWDSRVDGQSGGSRWGPCGRTCILPTSHCDEPSIGHRNKVAPKAHLALVIHFTPLWFSLPRDTGSIETIESIMRETSIHVRTDTIKNNYFVFQTECESSWKEIFNIKVRNVYTPKFK